MFYDPVYDTIRRRGGYRGIFREEGVNLDLEFENHKNVKKCIFCTLEQAWRNICAMGYQNKNFKIGLSLFVRAEKYTEKCQKLTH